MEKAFIVSKESELFKDIDFAMYLLRNMKKL